MPFDKREQHPSYGMAVFNHVTSFGTPLFGSEFKHRNFLKLTIKEADVSRELGRNWYFGHTKILEAYFSEAQFCELMTRTNMGDGVPCTLNYRIDSGNIAAPPTVESERQKIDKDFKDVAAKLAEELVAAESKLNAAIDSGKIGKTQLREISKSLASAIQNLRSNIPFVQRSFDEAIEATVTRAKIELEAHVVHMANQIGMKTMKDGTGTPIIMIEGEKE